MPYPKEFPQHILGVGRAFSRSDLVKMMGEAIKQNPSHSAKYRTAFGDLADTGRRLEYEILLPHESVELVQELEQLLNKMGMEHYLPDTCPNLPMPRALTNPDDMEYEKDFTEIKFKPLEITPSTNYDDAGQARPPIIFDK